MNAPNRARHAEWTATVARVPLGAAGKLVAGNLALQATAAGVIRNPPYFPIAATICLPVGSMHDFVPQLVSRGYAAWSVPAEDELHLTLPAADTGRAS